MHTYTGQFVDGERDGLGKLTFIDSKKRSYMVKVGSFHKKAFQIGYAIQFAEAA